MMSVDLFDLENSNVPISFGIAMYQCSLTLDAVPGDLDLCV